jgi:uncharacterized protein
MSPRRTGGRSATTPQAAGLILTPGAGADRNQSALVAVDEAVSAHGVVVRRVDFPYRLAGRKAPDRPPVLMASIETAARELAEELKVPLEQIALGGRSMGGRMCSMVVAEGFPAAALVLISYPLHPPGRPDRLRTEHFGSIGVRCLFLSGDRDAFGAPDELRSATGAIPGPVEHVWLEGGDHGLRRRDGDVAEIVSTWLTME